MLKYKSSALSLNVRPYKVFEAANWLISHSNLYKDEGIVLNNDWINQHSQDANDVNIMITVTYNKIQLMKLVTMKK